MWDEKEERFIKTEIKIKILQDNSIMYYFNGRVLKRDFKNQEILTNLEQIKHLQWQGELGENNKQTGKWIAKWDGNFLSGVGGYSKIIKKYHTTRMDQSKDYGKKYLKIIKAKHRYIKLENIFMARKEELGCIFTIIKRQMVDNIMSKVQKMVNGENQMIGFMRNLKSFIMGNILMVKKLVKWDIQFQYYFPSKLLLIGGGFYDEQGDEQKNGRWIELSNQFRRTSQIIYDGEYKNGKKVGRWDFYWNQYGFNQKIGGGSYEEGGDEVKVGEWVELSEGFNDNSKITYNGEYQNGKKFGKWHVLYCGKKIGEGLYDEGGNGFKIGRWIESSDLFKGSSQITNRGEYKNGIKVGRWDILYFNDQIGGGFYDDSGNGYKIGSWTELSDQFNNLSQVTYHGDYKNGTKVGRWDSEWNLLENKQIGGGSYDEEGIKCGKWVDLSDDFGYGYGQLQFIYAGEYKEGKKVGRWDMFYRRENQTQYQEFCGGQYDEEGNECKIGKWTELSHKFKGISEIIYDGEYKNGKKVGRWDFYWHYKGNTKLIGGGLYDESGNECKIGSWTELIDDFGIQSQVTYHGDYKQNKKVGRWDIWYQKNYDDMKNEMIGGGLYDKVGNQSKIGKWTEISHDFKETSQITYIGEYKNGKKVGLWEIEFEKEQIGGGSYDEEGDEIKIGQWIELHDFFSDTLQIIYQGEYSCGQKVSTWMEMQKTEDLEFECVNVKNYDD